GDCDTGADDLLSTRGEDERTDREIAADWLRDELADGEWHKAGEVKAGAKGAGIAERTLHRARVHLGVEDRREGFPAISEWRLAVVPAPIGTTVVPQPWHDYEDRSTEPNLGTQEPLLCQETDNGTTRAKVAGATTAELTGE